MNNINTSNSTVGVFAGPGSTVNTGDVHIIKNYETKHYNAPPVTVANINKFRFPPLIKSFRGREEKMKTLESLFREHKKVVIFGQAGMGKTETAKQFAMKFLDNGSVDKIFWINAERREDILTSFNIVGMNCDLPIADEKTKVQHIYEKFKDYTCMFIFDNVESRDQMEEFEPPEKHYLLVTSQEKCWNSDFKPLELTSLNTDGAVQVLQSILSDHYNNKEYERLAEVVSHVPLGLQVIAGYLHKFIVAKKPIDIEKYITDLEQTIIDIKIDRSLSNKYDKSIYGAVSLTLDKMDKLEDEPDAVRKLAYIVLCCCGFLNINYINRDHLERIIQFENDFNEFKFECSLIHLNNFSILSWSDDRLIMHRLMQRILQMYFKEKHVDIQAQSYTLCLKLALQQYWHYHQRVILSHADKNLDIFFNFYKVYLDKIKSTKQFNDNFQLHKNISYGLVKGGCINALIKICKYLGDLKGAYIDKCHLVITSIDCKQIEIFKFLSENNINVRDVNGDTFLHRAARVCCLNMIRLLVQPNVTVDIRNKAGETPLHVLCQFKNERCDEDIPEILKLLNCKELKHNKDKKGNTVLHAACRWNYSKLIQLLVTDYEYDVNIKNISGQTPLHLFCSNVNQYDKNVENTVALLKYDKLKDDIDTYGNSVLHIACYYSDNIELIHLLLEQYKCDVNMRNNDDNTALHMACITEVNWQKIQLLVSKTNVGTKNKSGQTPLHLFCSNVNQHDKVENILTLLTCDELTYETDLNGNTSLHAACYIPRNIRLIHLLVNEYSYKLDKNKSGQTPLHLFCSNVNKYYKDAENTLALLKCEELKYETDLNGNSILHAACHENCNFELIRSLIEIYKCDVNQQNNDGKSVLDIARQTNYIDNYSNTKVNLFAWLEENSLI